MKDEQIEKIDKAVKHFLNRPKEEQEKIVERLIKPYLEELDSEQNLSAEWRVVGVFSSDYPRQEKKTEIEKEDFEL